MTSRESTRRSSAHDCSTGSHLAGPRKPAGGRLGRSSSQRIDRRCHDCGEAGSRLALWFIGERKRSHTLQRSKRASTISTMLLKRNSCASRGCNAAKKRTRRLVLHPSAMWATAAEAGTEPAFQTVCRCVHLAHLVTRKARPSPWPETVEIDCR